ncbi:transcription factor SRM1-like [Vigna angularis]|uniref:transcription factor SRM1-like n=1 Tax=Phaseolus angularis TaxID=3914 RepID=UPI000809BBDB|nr:transcription factor SRM1-like [Vigna angularis]
MVNEDNNNIYNLNSEEWIKIIKSLNEKNPLSVDEILAEVNDQLSKLLANEVSIEPSKLVLPAPIMLLEEISSKDDVLNCANHIGKCNNSIVTVPRKKCKHWTEDEHKLFVLGHAKYQEKWKEVSKNYVPSKSSTQIASHAQKYFLRQNLPENKRKRKSIHDITVQDIDAEMKSRTKYAQLIIENLIL